MTTNGAASAAPSVWKTQMPRVIAIGLRRDWDCDDVSLYNGLVVEYELNNATPDNTGLVRPDIRRRLSDAFNYYRTYINHSSDIQVARTLDGIRTLLNDDGFKNALAIFGIRSLTISELADELSEWGPSDTL